MTLSEHPKHHRVEECCHCGLEWCRDCKNPNDITLKKFIYDDYMGFQWICCNCLRDLRNNIVCYSARLETFQGFIWPCESHPPEEFAQNGFYAIYRFKEDPELIQGHWILTCTYCGHLSSNLEDPYCSCDFEELRDYWEQVFDCRLDKIWD